MTDRPLAGTTGVEASMVGFLVLLATAWAALPPEVDPTIATHVGLREDAVSKLAEDPGATEALEEVLRNDPASDVRLRAAKELLGRWASGVGEPVAHRTIALWAAANADDIVRVAAVRALVDIGDDYTLVVEYLEDDDAGVRAAAWSACERFIERHPDRAYEVRQVIDPHEDASREGKTRVFIEKIKAKLP